MKIDLFNLADVEKAIAITDNHKADMKKRMTKIMEKVRQEAVFEANRLYQSASYAGFKDVVINGYTSTRRRWQNHLHTTCYG